MEPLQLTELIRKVRAGTATVAEKDLLEAHWNQSVEDQEFLTGLSETEYSGLGNTMYQNILQTIKTKEDIAAGEEAKVIPLSSNRWIWAAAIVILLVSVMSIWIYTKNSLQIEETAFGNRREIVLPDQSVVVLNGNSSIRYATDWNPEQNREVWIEGEAYFSVKHTKNHQKFIVHTPDKLLIEVLGTKFNVSNRRGITNVVLQEGKVKVSDTESTYVMKPGEMVSYSATRPLLTPQNTNPRAATSWKDNLLLYQDESLDSIANQLHDSYGIEVEFRDTSLKKELFTGSVSADSVDQLFEKFEKLYQTKITKQDNHYIIY
ncbi:FecR domain-containing protein [Cytophagaceae bacterium DM2B3-1]|uniref:FecR domain-containing protein n=1 Tax=Xanthocytophaga flava TaxID=3048013 RepID=A0ABT7CUD3_9BACT|nr:FecR domain-containing protein [Xanthocytophaga flavus]MDJ1497320.1 FecR domain-containing protein [Xanthocytophaga flavus]